MTKKNLPVYAIEDFRHFSSENDFYANNIPDHLLHHHFITTPHKHDFFLIVLFTKGSGTHEIDFTTYKIKPGTVFILRPGQMHNWKLSKDINGYVFFHTKSFYEKGFIFEKIQDYPFFSPIHNLPLVILKNKNYEKIKTIFKEILLEYGQDKKLKFQKLHALVTIFYVELARLYSEKKQIENKSYLDKLRQLEDFIDTHFKTKKYPYEYSELMHITENHLNRISKTCLNKTTSDLISERIILEAKRMLIHSKLSVTQIADELGYIDNSYFSRLFKKKTGETPIEFIRKNK